MLELASTVESSIALKTDALFLMVISLESSSFVNFLRHLHTLNKWLLHFSLCKQRGPF